MSKSCKRGRYLYRDSKGRIYSFEDILQLGLEEAKGVGVKISGVRNVDYSGSAVSDIVFDPGVGKHNYKDKAENKDFVINYSKDLHGDGIVFIPVDRSKFHNKVKKSLIGGMSSEGRDLYTGISRIVENNGLALLGDVLPGNKGVRMVIANLDTKHPAIRAERVKIKNNNYTAIFTNEEKFKELLDRVRIIERGDKAFTNTREYDISEQESTVYSVINNILGEVGVTDETLTVSGSIVRNAVARNLKKGRVIPEGRPMSSVTVYVKSPDVIRSIKEKYKHAKQSGRHEVVFENIAGVGKIIFKYTENPSKDAEENSLISSDAVVVNVRLNEDTGTQIFEYNDAEYGENIMSKDDGPSDTGWHDGYEFSEAVGIFVDHFHTSEHPERYDFYDDEVSEQEKKKAKKVLVKALEAGVDFSKAYGIIASIYGKDIADKVADSSETLTRLAYIASGMRDKLSEDILDAIIYAISGERKNALTSLLLDFYDDTVSIKRLEDVGKIAKKYADKNIDPVKAMYALWLWYHSQDIDTLRGLGKFSGSAAFMAGFISAVNNGHDFVGVETYEDTFNAVRHCLSGIIDTYNELARYGRKSKFLDSKTPFGTIAAAIVYDNMSIEDLNEKHSGTLDTKLVFENTEVIDKARGSNRTLEVLPGAEVEVNVVGEFKSPNVNAIITAHPYDTGVYNVKIIGTKGVGFDYSAAVRYVKQHKDEIRWFKKDEIYSIKGITAQVIYNKKKKEIDYKYNIDYDIVKEGDRAMRDFVNGVREKTYLPKMLHGSLEDFIKNNIEERDGMYVYRSVEYPSFELAAAEATHDYNKLKDIDTNVYDIVHGKFGDEWFENKRRIVYPTFAAEGSEYYRKLGKMVGFAMVFATKVIPIGRGFDTHTASTLDSIEKNYGVDDVKDDDIVFIPMMHNRAVTDEELEALEKKAETAIKKGAYAFIVPSDEILGWSVNEKIRPKIKKIEHTLESNGYKRIRVRRSNVYFYVKDEVVEESELKRPDVKFFRYSTMTVPLAKTASQFSTTYHSIYQFINYLRNTDEPEIRKQQITIDDNEMRVASDILKTRILPSLYGHTGYNIEEIKSIGVLQAYKMAKNADAIYIVSPILPKGSVLTRTSRLTRRRTVTAEVLHLFEYGLELGKEVYVFDYLQTNKWYKVRKENNRVIFESIDKPPVRRRSVGAVPHDVNRIHKITGKVSGRWLEAVINGISNPEGYKEEIGKMIGNDKIKDWSGVGVIYNGKIAKVIGRDKVKDKLVIDDFEGNTHRVFENEVLPVIEAHEFDFMEPVVKKETDENGEETSYIEYKDPITVIATITPAGVKYFKYNEDGTLSKEIGNKFQAKVRSENIDARFREYLREINEEDEDGNSCNIKS